MKNLIISRVLILCIVLLGIKTNYAQTTFGVNAGTEGGSTGSYFGMFAGQDNTETNNSFFGYQSGRYNATGSHNSFFGSLAGQNNSDGTHNSFFGMNAGRDNISGNSNAFVGFQSGRENETGEENSFFGAMSGLYNIDGSFNTFIGRQAGFKNVDGNENSFFGFRSGQHQESGEKNTFLGAWSGYFNIEGVNNTYIGYEAGRQATGDSNVFLGYNAGRFATGNSNIFIGNEAGRNETGDYKLYIANSSTDEPLIYGDFAASELTFNGKINIASSTGTSLIENVQHDHEGVLVDYLSIQANKNGGNTFLISETGLTSIGTNDPCYKHAADNDTTFLIVNGAATKSGDPFWYSASDQNLKKNINPLQKSLNKFLNLNFYSYQYKKTNQTRYGILAQEMEELFPHSMGKLIEEDGTEYLTFNPNNLFYTGLKATQEIGELSLVNESKIESLEKENDQLINITNNLQKENDHLKAELEAIKTALTNNGIDITQNNNNDNSLKPEVPHLLQNEPNPFTETTTIPYFLPQNIQDAFVVIYDAAGKTIEKHALPSAKGPGNLELSLMKKTTAKGAYSYSLFVDGNLIDNKKMLIQ